MKKLFCIGTIVLLATSMNGQPLGIKAGLNFSGLRGNDADSFSGLTSFHVGMVKEFLLLENLSLQSEILFSTQGAEIEGEEEEHYKLNYFTLPVMVKLYLNDSFSIQAGPQIGILAGETKNVVPFESKVFEYGVTGGMECALNKHFFIQGRYNIGLSNISDDADIKNSVIQLSLGYLF